MRTTANDPARTAIPSVRRLADNPIVRPHMDARMGDNINGPSLIRVPEWIPDPLGRYYLYFAHHDGEYIRLAYADELTGPWRTFEAGVLPLANAGFAGHVASPDVHVDHGERRIRMYFHGSNTRTGGGGQQTTRVALSPDGLHFAARPADLGEPYWRAFRWRDQFYALGMPGVFYRSANGLDGFEPGPTLFSSDMRHSAVLLRGNVLTVFYSNAGDCPERILLSTIDLSSDWMNWRESPPCTVVAPECDYEGAGLPCVASRRGIVREPVHQLRDPAIFQEQGRTYLLYSTAGEYGIAIAELMV